MAVMSAQHSDILCMHELRCSSSTLMMFHATLHDQLNLVFQVGDKDTLMDL